MLHASLALALTLAPSAARANTPSDLEAARPGHKLVVGGGITLGTGAASMIVGLGLLVPLGDAADRFWNAASPNETGFPSARWSDYRGVQHRIDRLTLAVRVLTIAGAVLVVAGTTLLITGGAIKRRARRDHARIRLDPDLVLRF